ncbi:uncharacterized protein LACBIDRAFT_334966 [Laccaria bicolor S238N-H82]|uniref:Predicted protein n=1 Tax=Laccaria bicolor (strain S238N-H82 / ATCC MYA-4686) TaxID=486041 RepID=B0E0X1_LACBS|nr:uncharacterized protein LACBIDRAFT_334966 [Laccaria bicolor S238N-H82]EDQ99474.1 predicted protein [Laccaria bicolor S238N-H82]|eukprot:XP_001889823.1 predicted protein [Laccaria bicolor S238N-H82]
MAQGRGRKPTQQPAPPRTAGHRAAPVNFREDPSSGEEFNFTPLDEHSADEDVQRPISPTSVEPVAGSAASTRPVTPSEQASEPSHSRTAPDIDFFFEHGSKAPPVSRTLCKLCRVNGIDLRQGADSFSASTSNGPLCNHLLSCHKDPYLQKCREMRLKVPALTSETGTASTPSEHGTHCPPFSQEALIQHLLNFIIADDQLLLLLHEDLEDKDIPHRTKMRESIIKAWHVYSKVLKQELAMIQGDSSHPHQALQAIPTIRATKKRLLATQLHCAEVLYEQYAPQAIEYFLSLPVHRELAKLRLTDMEWTVLQDFEIILGVPHQVQKIMLKECTPIYQAQFLCSKYIGIDWATTYYKKMDDSPAYVIVMFLNPSIQLSWIQRHWEPNYVARVTVIIKNTMQKYHDHLHGQVQQPTPGTAASQQQRQSWHDLARQYGLEDMMDITGASLQQVQGIEEQFELYENGLLSLRGTDIVGFWVISNKTHPIFILGSFRFSLKQQQLNFMEGWAVTEDKLEYYADDNEDSVDLLGKLTSEITEDGIDIDEVIHVIGQDDED